MCYTIILSYGTACVSYVSEGLTSLSWGVHAWNMFLGSYLRVREMYKGAFGEVREKMAEHRR